MSAPSRAARLLVVTSLRLLDKTLDRGSHPASDADCTFLTTRTYQRPARRRMCRRRLPATQLRRIPGAPLLARLSLPRGNPRFRSSHTPVAAPSPHFFFARSPWRANLNLAGVLGPLLRPGLPGPCTGRPYMASSGPVTQYLIHPRGKRRERPNLHWQRQILSSRSRVRRPRCELPAAARCLPFFRFS